MRDFACAACGNMTYFENRNCIRCGAKLGFVLRVVTRQVEPAAHTPSIAAAA